MRRVLVRLDRCIGCRSCEIACVRQHLEEYDEPHARPSAVPRIRVEGGPLERTGNEGHEDIHPHRHLSKSLVVLCQHCDEPGCVEACTAGALVKQPDGTVRHIPELCTACLMCLDACSYGAIYQEPTGNTVVKCDLCAGKETPACVESCAVEALYLE